MTVLLWIAVGYGAHQVVDRRSTIPEAFTGIVIVLFAASLAVGITLFGAWEA